jgi:hypothetical protein
MLFDSLLYFETVGYKNVDWIQISLNLILWFGFCVYNNELPGFIKGQEFLGHKQSDRSTDLKRFTCPEQTTNPRP